MRQSIALVATAALLMTAGTAWIASAQDPEPRSETVAGWRIEDVDDELEEDPLTRVIRMTREVDGHELGYEMTLYAGGGPGWGSTRFGIATHGGNQACTRSASAATEIGPVAERPARVRALLARELRRIERECRSAPGSLDGLLEGFEEAFARFTTFHGERYAAIQTAAEHAESEYASNDMMTMDTNVAVDMNDSMDWDMDVNTTEMTDIDMTVDMNATADDLEAAADDARRAADEALEAANALSATEPK